MSVQSLLAEIRELRELIKALQNIQNMARSLSSVLSSASSLLKEVIVNGQAYDKGKLSEIVRDLGTLSSLCGSAIAKANKKITELQEEIRQIKEAERERNQTKLKSANDSNVNVDLVY